MPVRVSVCMATYNGERYIREQMSTILSELHEDDEVIISDDSSTDHTLQLIREFKDPRIRIFENQKFRNHILNFEFALSQALGKFVFMSDQDDAWEKGKVETMLSILRDKDMALSNAVLVDAEGKIIQEHLFMPGKKVTGFLRNYVKNNYVGCCMAFRREVLNYALPFPAGINSHDMWLGLIGEFLFTTGYTEKNLIRFRRHGKNFSAHDKSGDTFITGKSPYTKVDIFKHRSYMITKLVRRKIKKTFN